MDSHSHSVRRFSRRQALGAGIALGGSAAAGLGLLALRSKSTTETRSGATIKATPVDSTNQARKGGVFKSYQPLDVTSLDPIGNASFTARLSAAYAYPRLFKFVTSPYPHPISGGVEGDLVDSYEISSDGLRLAMKLRRGLAWDQAPPTSGRTIDATDVLSTLQRFKAVNPFGAEIFYDAQRAPFGAIEKVSSPEPGVMVFDLHTPDTGLLQSLAGLTGVFIMPREADGGFDPRNQMRGHGPWRLKDYQQSAWFTWERNPDYYIRDRPFPDGITQPIITEYSTRLAEFHAGNIWNSVVAQEDLLASKAALPQTLIFESDTFPTATPSLAFGYAASSPWRDQRLRQAANYLLDREAMADALTLRRQFAEQGISVPARLHTIIGAGWDDYWVDPLETGRFGEEGRYFRFNPMEARQLIAAASYSDGFSTDLYFNGSPNYGREYSRSAEIIAASLAEAGIRARLSAVDYQTAWLPNFHFSYSRAYHGSGSPPGFNGMILRAKVETSSLQEALLRYQHSAGSSFEGCAVGDGDAADGDDILNSLVVRFRGSLDHAVRQSLAVEIARYVARTSYFIQAIPFATKTLELVWPVIGNYGVFRSPRFSPQITESVLSWWIDDSKPPLRSA